MKSITISDNEFAVGGVAGKYLRLHRTEEEAVAYILPASVLNLEIGKDFIHINTLYRRYTLTDVTNTYTTASAILAIIAP